MRIWLALLLVLLLASFGCSGESQRPSEGAIDRAKVTRAFAGAGLQFPNSLNALLRQFEGGKLSDGVIEQVWDADRLSESPSIEVRLFPTEQMARQAMTVTTRKTDDTGKPTRPLARVGNTVVTVYADATPNERQRVMRAVAALRKG